MFFARDTASVSASHQTSNLIHQTWSDGPVQLSLRPHFDHPGLGNDAGPRRRQRDATGALASPALLGTRRLGREPVSVSGGGVVDFLSLAQPAAVGIFLFYRCPDFTHHLVPGLYRSFPPESSLDDFVNYKTHYYSNHRVFFVLFAVFSPVDFVDTLSEGISHLVALGPLYFISSILFFARLVIAAITRNERYHQCYAIFFLAQTTLISFNLFRTLI